MTIKFYMTKNLDVTKKIYAELTFSLDGPRIIYSNKEKNGYWNTTPIGDYDADIICKFLVRQNEKEKRNG